MRTYQRRWLASGNTRLAGVITAGILITTLAAAAQGATLLVPQQHPTIAAAIAVASGNDEILVSPGVYRERIDLSNRFVRLRSVSGPEVTIIDAESGGTAVTWSNAITGCTLDGFTIAKGRGADGAAGVDFSGLRSGGAGRAGGLRASGILRVQNCIFRGNVGGSGGAGLDSSGAEAGNGGSGAPGAASADNQVSFVFCTFVGNLGGTGGAAGGGLPGVSQAGLAGVGGPGAIGVSGATPRIVCCRFIDNHGATGGRGAPSRVLNNNASQAGAGSPGGPGAIAIYGGVAAITCCIMYGNSGGDGGAGGDGAQPQLGAATSGGVGGAGGAGTIWSSTNLFSVANGTFIGNRTSNGGAGGTAGGSGATAGAAGATGPAISLNSGGSSIRNSIIWQNQTPLFLAFGPTISTSVVQGGYGGLANLDVDPRLDADFRPRGDSPCIDAGIWADVPIDSLDIDADFDLGERTPYDVGLGARLIDTPGVPNAPFGPPPPPDMGAYEFGNAIETLVGDMNCDGAVNNFDIEPFVSALINRDEYRSAFPTCNLMNGDIDGNGDVSNFDIDPFVNCILNLPLPEHGCR